jgi:carbonic anhydrase/acetyltransferase-like protein (isoleucine patch superfamily)
MSLYTLDGVAPAVAEDAWVAPGAQVIGRVTLEAGASVWFNAVLRGDGEPVVIGPGSNVQDGSVCHTDAGFPMIVGADCTIGHTAIIHGCSIGDGCLIGMGATVLTGARIGRRVLIGAGALVTEGKQIPDGVLVIGRPGKVARDLTEAELDRLRQSAATYRTNAVRFRTGLRPA